RTSNSDVSAQFYTACRFIPVNTSPTPRLRSVVPVRGCRLDIRGSTGALVALHVLSTNGSEVHFQLCLDAGGSGIKRLLACPGIAPCIPWNGCAVARGHAARQLEGEARGF